MCQMVHDEVDRLFEWGFLWIDMYLAVCKANTRATASTWRSLYSDFVAEHVVPQSIKQGLCSTWRNGQRWKRKRRDRITNDTIRTSYHYVFCTCCLDGYRQGGLQTPNWFEDNMVIWNPVTLRRSCTECSAECLISSTARWNPSLWGVCSEHCDRSELYAAGRLGSFDK